MSYTYDPKSVSVIIQNVHLTGFGESMVEIEKDEDNYETSVGAQGDVVRTKINNNLGTITLTLQPTSPQIPFMNNLANTGDLVPVTVIYAGEQKEITSATQCYISKPGARKYANALEDREYEIKCLDLVFE
ncbi:DUF3277 family protein [Paenibacillus sp. GSMTC-2017]|uniref:phage structural protein n=1 Tax=Paenibacillus sp. GSMTC-2017 TaxID=2794350 RepID=UPI0018D7C745|nr:phage protein [Paenibacillus sp. GSMTC-2017]MBH5316706.1 DUF3277 family protein [Paenibacillus sp. GSMTC-2017]